MVHVSKTRLLLASPVSHPPPLRPKKTPLPNADGGCPWRSRTWSSALVRGSGVSPIPIYTRRSHGTAGTIDDFLPHGPNSPVFFRLSADPRHRGGVWARFVEQRWVLPAEVGQNPN